MDQTGAKLDLLNKGAFDKIVTFHNLFKLSKFRIAFKIEIIRDSFDRGLKN